MMKKITFLAAFLIVAMSYGQILQNGDFESSTVGIMSKTTIAVDWFAASNRTTTPDCEGTTIPAREDSKIEDESGNKHH